ncbi:DUF368 domain-containing protein [Natroniella sulfidigena]|uniref:DUF368 domain-containing protein n=1 Tax=Natroniella sulfidigena TaxID=723921 RepID=UPI00200A1F57|nr:DUF368 domain-containing protein [Natroniella sulfidigena]MCK8815751.1 DUF368 domain-containing protein [Natroniella sulfidigena]
MNDFLELFLKGIPLGIANTLPGVSGGTMALILRIYGRLVRGIKKIEVVVLTPIGLGAVVGAFVSSKVIVNLLDSHPSLIFAFLLGLILASSKITAQEIEEFNLNSVALIGLGVVIAYFYSAEVTQVASGGEIALSRFFTGGLFGSIAMILPGVSGGTILVMLGLYEGVIGAISELELLVLALFAIGVASGLLLFSWLLSYLLERFRSLLMAFLTGLILGSARSVIPTTIGLAEVITFILGVVLILLLSDNNY